MRIPMRLMATMVGGAALLSGCVLELHQEQRTATVGPETGAQGLRVDTHNGRVTVTAGADAEIVITAELRARTPERLAEMKVVAEQDETGALVIAPRPPAGGWRSNEGCSIDVAVPRSATEAGIRVKTDNGRITIAGCAGPLDLRTSNGRILVRDADSQVTADTSNGRIELSDVHGPVKADTSNGSVFVRLTPDGQGPVDVDTSNGSVTLEISPDFAGELAMRTSNGSIHVPSGVRPRAGSRRFAAIVLNEGGAESTIATSNGSINVRMLEID